MVSTAKPPTLFGAYFVTHIGPEQREILIPVNVIHLYQGVAFAYVTESDWDSFLTDYKVREWFRGPGHVHPLSLSNLRVVA